MSNPLPRRVRTRDSLGKADALAATLSGARTANLRVYGCQPLVHCVSVCLPACPTDCLNCLTLNRPTEPLFEGNGISASQMCQESFAYNYTQKKLDVMQIAKCIASVGQHHRTIQPVLDNDVLNPTVAGDLENALSALRRYIGCDGTHSDGRYGRSCVCCVIHGLQQCCCVHQWMYKHTDIVCIPQKQRYWLNIAGSRAGGGGGLCLGSKSAVDDARKCCPLRQGCMGHTNCASSFHSMTPLSLSGKGLELRGTGLELWGKRL